MSELTPPANTINIFSKLGNQLGVAFQIKPSSFCGVAGVAFKFESAEESECDGTLLHASAMLVNGAIQIKTTPQINGSQRRGDDTLDAELRHLNAQIEKIQKIKGLITLLYEPTVVEAIKADCAAILLDIDKQQEQKKQQLIMDGYTQLSSEAAAELVDVKLVAAIIKSTIIDVEFKKIDDTENSATPSLQIDGRMFFPFGFKDRGWRETLKSREQAIEKITGLWTKL